LINMLRCGCSPPERLVSFSRAGSTVEIMYTVYVLQDEKGKFYKGCTNNLVRRLREHKSWGARTTSMMGKLELVYKEEYSIFKEARAREVYLKTAAGRRFLKTKLRL
jgi:putative endonuclease